MIYFLIFLSLLMIIVLSFLSGWCVGKKTFDFAKIYGVGAIPFIGILIFIMSKIQ